MKPVVAIVQRRLTHYRVPLFQAMRDRLAAEGVSLRVLHGDPTASEASKDDGGDLPWAEHLATRYFRDGGICWQPFARRVRDCELVVVTQENKLVSNLPLLLDPWRRQAIAFWGHGGNLQARRPDSLAERFKRWTTRRVDCWFAYTELSARLVRQAGYPPGRITVLNNSIDMSALKADLQRACMADDSERRRRLGLGPGPLGVFIGSLYPEKRIDWLLQAARELRQRIPGFQLVVAGAGPDQQRVERAVAVGGVVYLGPVSGPRKAELLASASLCMNPGLVGLGILDAFAAGLPLVTTNCGLHSPEIAYLEPGANGLLTEDELGAYVSACERILVDPVVARTLADGARRSGDRYSLEDMTSRFCQGVLACLESRRPSADRQQPRRW